MRRALTVTMLLGLLTSVATAAPSPLLISGSTTIGVIDTDDNGPDPSDCVFMATIDPDNGQMMITSMQIDGTPIAACPVNLTASGFKGSDSSSNFAGVQILAGLGGLPFIAELIDETADPDPNDPVSLNDLRDFGIGTGPEGVARLQICSAGGAPAALVNLFDGGNLLVNLSFFPDAINPTFLCIPGPPLMFELDSNGFAPFDAYIPVTADGHITAAASSDPTTLFVDIDLNALPGCARHGAPTMTQWTIIGLAMTMLGLGMWALSRRPGFYENLARL